LIGLRQSLARSVLLLRVMLANVVSCTLVGIAAAQINVERAIDRDLPPSTPVDLGAIIDLVIQIR
jgi:hypothetical protein